MQIKGIQKTSLIDFPKKFESKKKAKENEIVELREEELPVEDEIVEEEKMMEKEVENGLIEIL